MQGQAPRYAEGGPIQNAVVARDWHAARLALAEKLAKAADATDSARDIKAIAHELLAVLNRCEADQYTAEAANSDSPIARILTDAQERGFRAV